MTYEPDASHPAYAPQVQQRFDQQPPGPGYPFPPPNPEPDGPKPGRGRRIAALAVTGLAGLVLGTAINGSSSGTSSAPSVTTKTVSARPAVEPSKAAATSTVIVTETQKPKKMFGDGAWMVGRDIPAGRYTTIEEVGGNCYWERHNTKAAGIDAIIANGNVTGGHPTVIVRTGEEFRSMGCGDWRAA